MMLFGFGFDSFLGMTGQIQFAQGARWSPPAMVALWANLSTAFPLSLSWLRTRLALSAALGLLGGMAAYAGGAKLNAISIPDPVAWHLVVIGALWAIVLPSALWIHLRLFPVVPATQSTPTGDI
jgi:hypothetical protein